MTGAQLNWLLSLREDRLGHRRYIPHPRTVTQCQALGWVEYCWADHGRGFWCLTEAGLTALEDFKGDDVGGAPLSPGLMVRRGDQR